MLPTFGKLNLIAVVPQKKYFKFEVVAFKAHDGKLYTHRIYFINSNYFSTKGDNQEIQNYEKNLPIKNIEGSVKLLLKII